MQIIGRISVDAYINASGDVVGTIYFHVNNFKLFGKGTGEAVSNSPVSEPKGKKKQRTKNAAEVTGNESCER